MNSATKARNAARQLIFAGLILLLAMLPSRDNALKLVGAIKGKDLSGKVGSKLPAKADYK